MADRPDSRPDRPSGHGTPCPCEGLWPPPAWRPSRQGGTTDRVTAAFARTRCPQQAHEPSHRTPPHQSGATELPISPSATRSSCPTSRNQPPPTRQPSGSAEARDHSRRCGGGSHGEAPTLRQIGVLPTPARMVPRTGRYACSRKRAPWLDAISPNLGTGPRPWTSQGLFRDFHACLREFPGTFRRVSREGPDSAESHERTGQGLLPQHSMMFTASPPRVVSLYFTDMFAQVSFMVLMTLLASTYATARPSRWQARGRQHAFHCSSRRAPGQGRRGCCRRAPRSAGRRPGGGGQPDDRRSAGARVGPGWMAGAAFSGPTEMTSTGPV